ncbi:MAG: heme lyase CcmF/NrfE family subunit [Methylophilaceae bacterium]|jgi:cytochrome c-type biogenesis protein CcmF|nr:MAG: heme lyase CcmF/NrfE family subunit [Methylophilaceae bacterium]
MMPDIGHYALMLALVVALLQGVLPLIGLSNNNEKLFAFATPMARIQSILVILSFLILDYAFYANDFSVYYVAATSNSQLPLIYRLAAIWGGHEGSMLFWVSILAVWTLAVTFFAKALPLRFRSSLLAVMGLISVGFIMFILFTSNPFERIFPVPYDGRDLNPLLQDPGMVFHPPLLYMGYVGFSVAFAFAIAALLDGRLDVTWARWTRPWTTAAWVFLTLGIALGSRWAYYELGWGGWWFWDAVENASFMPWLIGTALIHSLAVTEKRNAFKAWTVLLSICAFSLSLLGTFLVRSGVLTSVHAFATDPSRGLFILLFLVVVIGGALALFALRAPTVGLGEKFDLVSRESLLLSNNVVLFTATASVLLGTLYPLLIDAMNMGKISVGPPYFDTVFVAIMVPGIFLMGIGPIANWKKASIPDLASKLKWALAISVISALLVPSMMGRLSPMIFVGLLMAFWVMSSVFVSIRTRLNTMTTGSLTEKFKTFGPAFNGMLLAHFGLAIFIIGVTMVKGYEREHDITMQRGETKIINGYDFRFEGIKPIRGPNYVAKQGQFYVTKDGKPVAILTPEKRLYPVQSAVMTEASISINPVRDIYISLGEELEEGGWSVRIYFKPFVQWIWLGCVLMGIGGILTMTDKRYRRKSSV